MALIDRVKERIETDLSDAELGSMIDAVQAEIVERHGPTGAVTILIDDAAGRQFIDLPRPMDEAQPATVTEICGAVETVLDAADWRTRHRGRTLERLPTSWQSWAPVVRVAYTPVDDTARREAVTIQVLQLEIQARGLSSERAGDWQAHYPELAAAREQLIASLTPRQGLVLA